MKKFLRTFQDSLSSKKFYASLPEKTLGSSIGYYFTLVFIAAIIFAAVISWNILPVVSSFTKNIGPTIIEYYPEDLEVVVKDGIATHNQEDPVFIPLALPTKDGFEVIESEDLSYKYALVIDTKNTFDLETFEEYETVSYLGRDSFVVINDDGNLEVIRLEEVPEEFTINRETILSFIGQIQPILQLAPALVFLFVFLGGFFFYAFHLVRIVLAALIILLIYRLRGLKHTFKQSYQVAIHASTLGLILVSGILLLVDVNIPVPFLFTAVTVIMAALFMPQPKTESSSELLADQS